MLLFNILARDDRRLRAVARIIGLGLFILLTGLWIVQIVCANRFETNLKKQSVKRVGIPAIRGRILDRNSQVFAGNRPHYNAILYLEDLQGQFLDAYKQLAHAYSAANPQLAQAHGHVSLTEVTSKELHAAADCQVVSNITYQVGATLRETRILNTNAFLRHYSRYPYVPFEIVPNMTTNQLAAFAEQLSGQPDLEIETEPVRYYPNDTLAAHVLGFVRREAMEAEEVSYTLPDYQGVSGIEHIFDSALRGQPGVKLVLVNSMNYRQSEEVETPNAPGDDIYLTIDMDVQRVAEHALAAAQAHTRGAVVVMDVRNGDILAMASAPTFDPNEYVTGLTKSDVETLADPKYTPQINRAIDGAYPPGSTFKIITSIACLENGLDPNEKFDSPGYYQGPHSKRKIGDTAGAGKFNFTQAFFRSSNTYFIQYGLMAGLSNILEVARRFDLGEKTDFVLHPEVAGNIPAPEEAAEAAHRFSVPDICIGQEITTTPLQMAGMISAIANGGKIYWPRLVSHSYMPETGEEHELFAPGRLRTTVKINPQHLELIRYAMLQDTEHAADADAGVGSAYLPFHRGGAPLLPNFHVAGKTGTAELKSTSPNSPHRITWFDSFAPYENPRYAVVVMVEDGSFGGPTCGPVAEAIYAEIIKKEKTKNWPGSSLARN